MRTAKTAKGRRRRSGAADLDDFRSRYLAAVEQMNATFVDRADAVRVMALAMLTRVNYLLIGVHGTAKTALIKCFLKHVDGARLFAPGTCGSFTTLDELVGPPDIQAFQQGSWSRKTEGRLADCDFAFLDEVMKANDGAINSLLTLLNERELDGAKVELRCVGSATNWPEVKARSEKVEAMFDRFLLRVAVGRVGEEDKLAKLFVGATRPDPATSHEHYEPLSSFTLAEMDAAFEAARQVAFPEKAARKLANVVCRLRQEGVDVSERRAVQMVEVMKTAAWLRGQDSVTLEVFDVLAYGCWIDEPHIEIVEAVVDSIDQDTIKACVGKIDQARRDYAAIKGAEREHRLSRAPAVIKQMRSAAAHVKDVLKVEGVTERGKQRIREEMAAMRGEFELLNGEVRKELGLKVDGGES